MEDISTGGGTIKAHEDFVAPFMIDGSALRGRVVRLGPALDTILSRHRYPAPVSRLLGELLILTAMLGASLKFSGVFTIQTKGDGPIRFMVADCTSEGEIRGYAEVEGPLPASPKTLAELMGKGHLAITIDQSGERYQGIVELDGESLTEAVMRYFEQSEQLEVALSIAVGQHLGGQNAWCAGGIMLQRLPKEEQAKTAIRLAKEGKEPEDPEESWNRAKIFAASIRDHELLDPFLSPKELLFRLFQEDGVWAYDPKPVRVGCRCTRERVSAILSTIPQSELEEMKVNGKLAVTCQFCNKDEVFTSEELAALFGGAPASVKKKVKAAAKKPAGKKPAPKPKPKGKRKR